MIDAPRSCTSNGAVSEPPPPARLPLPEGMQDLLPAEARTRRALIARLLEVIGRAGYMEIAPPLFEFTEVLERGMGDLDPRDVLRFVEPASGEVAALRPDMTPQIARVIATRLRAHPSPYRLAYEGTVLRRRSGRARTSRQIPQVGVELAGVGAPEGDLEALGLLEEALAYAGLEDFTLDLGHAGIVHALLRGLPEDLARRGAEALARKNESALEAFAVAAREVGAEAGRHAEVLAELARLHGQVNVLDRGAELVRGTPAAPSLDALRHVALEASRRGPARVTVDLGEVRGFAYYTGLIFHAYAEGPGEPVAAGGRYDALLARFGVPMDAVGFAIDLRALEWARRAAGCAEDHGERIVVVGPPDDARVLEARRRGLAAVAIADEGEARAYADAWGFSRVLPPGEEL